MKTRKLHKRRDWAGVGESAWWRYYESRREYLRTLPVNRMVWEEVCTDNAPLTEQMLLDAFAAMEKDER